MGAWEEYQQRKKNRSISATTTGSQGTRRMGAWEEYQQRKEKSRSELRTSYQKWIEDTNTLLGQSGDASERVKPWNQKENEPDYYTTQSSSVRNLTQRANNLKNLTRQAKLSKESTDRLIQTLDEGLKNFQGYQSALDQARDYYSQWNSQEEYDTAMQAYQQEQERNAMTIEQVREKIGALETELQRATDAAAAQAARKTNEAFTGKGMLNPSAQQRKNAAPEIEVPLNLKRIGDQRASAGEEPIVERTDGTAEDEATRLKEELETYQSLLESKEREQYQAMTGEELEQAYQEAQAALDELDARRERGEEVSDRAYDDAKSRAQNLQYLRLPQREDFAQMAGQIESQGRTWWGGWNDAQYEAINADAIQDADSTDRNLLIYQSEGNLINYAAVTNLTDQERDTYNYLYQTEGREQADEYLKYLEPTLNQRQTEKVTQQYQDMSNEGGWSAVLANLATIPMSLVQGRAVLEDVVKGITGQPIDTNSEAHAAVNITDAVRSTTAQNIENYWDERDSGLAKSVLPFLYQTGMSIADNVLRAATSGGSAMAGGALAGMGAGASTIVDAKNRGLSDEQALLSGAMAGIAETVFEKISLGNLLKQESPKTIRIAIKNILKQSGVEASEEVGTEIANVLTDQLINGDQSNYMLAVQSYMAQGMDEGEARKKAAGDVAMQIVEAGLAGAISGGFMSSGKSAIDAAAYQMAYRAENQQAKETGTTGDQILSYAQGLPQRTQAKALADSLAGNKRVSNQEMGRLSFTVREDVAQSLHTAQNAQQLDERYREFSRGMPESLQSYTRQQYERASRNIAAREALQDEAQGNAKPAGKYQRAAARDVQTGEELEIQGIASSSEDGSLILETNDGAKSIDDVDIRNASQEMLYRQAQGYDTVTARALVRHYQGNIGAETYARYFQTLYDIGESGMPWSSVERSADAVVQTLGESAANAAWTLGNRAARMEAAAPSMPGNIKRVGTGRVTDNTGRASDDFMQQIDEALAGRTGFDVRVENSLENSANGMLQAAIQQFVFAADADNEVTARIHELGEFGSIYNPNWERDVVMPIADYIARKAGFQGYAQLVQAYRQQYAAVEGSKTSRQALLEAVNDALGGLFTTEEGARDFVAWLTKDSGLTAPEQKTVLQRLVEFFDRLIRSIAEYMKKTPLYDAARMTAQMKLDEARAMRKVFFDALDVAVENAAEATGRARATGQQAQKNTAEEGRAVRHSIRDSFYSEIDAWDGKSKRTFQVGRTSDVLKSIGVKDLGVVWHGGKIAEIMRKHPGMTKDIIKQVPQILENPIIILASRNSDSRLVIFGTVKDNNGVPVTAILELQPTNKGGQVMNMNIIASAYGKDNTKNLVMNSGLIYLDPNKNRTNNWLQSVGLQLPSDTTVLGPIGRISYPDGKVKIDSIPYSQYMQTAGVKFSEQDKDHASISENGDQDTARAEEKRFSINPQFNLEYDQWDKKSPRVFFYVGTTSPVLEKIGIPKKKIYWDSSKIIKIRAKHPGMNDRVIKQVPYILEYPVVVMQSKTDARRITLFGDVIDANGKPVLAVLEMHPVRNGIQLDEFKIASAYGKDNPQQLLDTSPILYIDGDKQRTSAWERRTRLQLPVDRIQADSNSTISQNQSEVNTSISKSGEQDTARAEEKRFSINPQFAMEVEQWYDDGQESGEEFILGSTGPVLQGLGAIESDIYMKGDKISKILSDHPEMTLEEIQRIPEILEDPVLILKSRNISGQRQNTRMVLFGSVKARNGKPVLAVLDLRPVEKNLVIQDMQKVTSSYTKDTNPAEFVRKSEVLYADKKRAIPLLRTIGLQLRPIELQRYGSMGSISYIRQNVNISGEDFDSVFAQGEDSSDATDRTDYLDRHSLRMVSIPESEYRGLVEKNAALEERVKNLMLEFLPSVKGRLRPNQNRLDIAAGRLLRESGSGMSRKQLSDRLADLWSVINNTEDLIFEDAMSLATDIALEMIQTKTTNLDPMAREILDTIRSFRVYLDDTSRGEIKSAFDSISNYKKLLGSAVRFTEQRSEGVEIDTLMQSLAESFPGMFGRINPADAPVALLEKISGLRSMVEDGEDGYLTREERVYQQAIRLLQETALIAAHETYADKQKGKAEKLRQELRAQMQQWKQQKQREYNQRLERVKRGISEELRQLRKQRNAETDPKAREALQRKIDRLNQREGERVAQVRAMYERRISDRLETERKEAQRNAIRKQAQRLTRLLDRPTNQNHVGAEMLPDIQALVSLLSKKEGLMNDEFRQRAAALAIEYKRPGNVAEAFYDEDTAQRLEDLALLLKDRKYSHLNSSELQEVRKIVDHFSKLVSDYNKMLTGERAESWTKTSETAYGEINRLDDRRYRRFMMWEPVRGAREGVSDFLNRLTVKPEQFFLELGDTMYKLYREMRKGEGIWATDAAQAREFLQKLKQEYPVDEWFQSEEKVTFTTKEGKTVSMSLGEAMSLYNTILRKQGEEHVMSGGFVLEDAVREVTVQKEGKKKETTYVTDDNEHTPMTLDDMQRFVEDKNMEDNTIGGVLTREQKEFAAKLSGYLSKNMAQKGNAVSRRLYGYDKFTEERYWPLHTSENYVPFSGKKHGDPQVKNKAFTKSLTPHSHQPVIIRDILDVWANHINEMGLYHGLALPMEDFNRVYNYTSQFVKGYGQNSLKALIEKKLGKRANEYIEQFMVDLNGGVRPSSMDRWASRWISRFKRASVMANLSVMIQQPSAIMRAMDEVDPKYFAHLKDSKSAYTRKGWEELKRYAPVAIIKEMGGFDTNMGPGVIEWIRDDKSWLKKRFDFITSRGAEKMDEITWCHIWNAVKRETADRHPELDGGSEEFLQTAGERFHDVISRTQVYDSVFSRSEAMRNRSAAAQMITSFMGEPLTSYNMLRHSAVMWSRGEKGGARRFARTYGAYLGSVILNSLLRALPYAMRDDEEDKNLLEKYVTAAVDGVLWDWTSMLPFLRDVVSIIEGYDVERADMALISDLVNAGEKLFSVNASNMDKIRGVTEAVANIFGIPLKNVTRDVEALWRTGAELVAAAAGEGKAVTAAGLLEAVRSGVGVFPERSTAELMVIAAMDRDTEYYETLKQMMKDQGKTDNQIDAAMAGALADMDDRVTEAAQKRISGDTDGYMRIVEAIKADGISQDVAVRAVNRAVGQIQREDDGDSGDTQRSFTGEAVLTNSDILTNLEENDVSGAQKIIDDMMSQAETQEDKKKKRSSIKSAITSYYKPLYKDGGLAERSEIRGLLSRLRVDGKALYSGDDYVKWKE